MWFFFSLSLNAIRTAKSKIYLSVADTTLTHMCIARQIIHVAKQNRNHKNNISQGSRIEFVAINKIICVHSRHSNDSSQERREDREQKKNIQSDNVFSFGLKHRVGDLIQCDRLFLFIFPNILCSARCCKCVYFYFHLFQSVAIPKWLLFLFLSFESIR